MPHERLLLKLNRHAIDGHPLLWFRKFLTNRQKRVTIRETLSNWSPVTSGVPQGRILGPTLFLVYVNNIPNVVTSSIEMFAEDTKIYREINNAEDTLALPSDLDCLEYWTRNWQVKFNPQKCEVMRITHKQDKSKHPYHLSNTELESVNSCKDLGLPKRTVGSKNREIFSVLYKSLIRPILEYACPVWSPCLVKDKLAIVLYVFFGRQIERLKIAVRARGGGTQQIFVREGSAPESNLLPFYMPLFTKKVALSYTFY